MFGCRFALLLGDASHVSLVQGEVSLLGVCLACGIVFAWSSGWPLACCSLVSIGMKCSSGVLFEEKMKEKWSHIKTISMTSYLPNFDKGFPKMVILNAQIWFTYVKLK